MRFWNRIQAEVRDIADRTGARLAAIESEMSELEVRRTGLEKEREGLGLVCSRLQITKPR
jgi:hypothetical protein